MSLPVCITWLSVASFISHLIFHPSYTLLDQAHLRRFCFFSGGVSALPRVGNGPFDRDDRVRAWISPYVCCARQTQQQVSSSHVGLRYRFMWCVFMSFISPWKEVWKWQLCVSGFLFRFLYGLVILGIVALTNLEVIFLSR